MARVIDKDKLITSMAWHDQQGMISCIDDILDIIEAFPTLTQPNEPLTLEKLENMEDTTPVWWDQINSWVLVYKGNLTTWSGKSLYAKGCNGKFYRRPPEGVEKVYMQKAAMENSTAARRRERRKPILFNTEMVRAILEGRKTVTRQPVKFGRGQNPAWSGYVPDGGVLYGSNNIPAVKAPYQPGDILWVRETWCESMGQAGKYFYRAYAGPRDEMKEYAHSFNRWHPSIHMPRDAARLFLRVTEVRANKLHDVNYFDCLSEGVPYRQMETDIVQDFSALWDSTIKPADRPVYGWAANPWVWIIQFERISRPPEGEKK